MVKFISKQDISVLPIKKYPGPVHVIDSDEQMSEAVKALSGEKVLGFDTETRPAFKKGESYSPSLLQIAASGAVYLFRIAHIKSYEQLAGVLTDPAVLKTGISISDDLRKLNEVWPFTPAGFIELADMAAKRGIKNAGIRGLAALLFGFRISKQTRLSRWDAPHLEREQIIYAATDAWICREIYFALLDKPCISLPRSA